jgi:hypothetical protein
MIASAATMTSMRVPRWESLCSVMDKYLFDKELRFGAPRGKAGS